MNIRKLIRVKRHQEEGTLFPPNLSQLKSPAGKWWWVGENLPDRPNPNIFIISHTGEPGRVAWNGRDFLTKLRVSVWFEEYQTC